MWPASFVSQNTPTRFARIFGVCHTFATIPYFVNSHPLVHSRLRVHSTHSKVQPLCDTVTSSASLNPILIPASPSPPPH